MKKLELVAEGSIKITSGRGGDFDLGRWLSGSGGVEDVYRFLGVDSSEKRVEDGMGELLRRAGERMVREGSARTVGEAVEVLRKDWNARKGQFESHAFEQFGSRYKGEGKMWFSPTKPGRHTSVMSKGVADGWDRDVGANALPNHKPTALEFNISIVLVQIAHSKRLFCRYSAEP